MNINVSAAYRKSLPDFFSKKKKVRNDGIIIQFAFYSTSVHRRLGSTKVNCIMN